MGKVSFRRALKIGYDETKSWEETPLGVFLVRLHLAEISSIFLATFSILFSSSAKRWISHSSSVEKLVPNPFRCYRWSNNNKYNWFIFEMKIRKRICRNRGSCNRLNDREHGCFGSWICLSPNFYILFTYSPSSYPQDSRMMSLSKSTASRCFIEAKQWIYLQVPKIAVNGKTVSSLVIYPYEINKLLCMNRILRFDFL